MRTPDRDSHLATTRDDNKEHIVSMSRKNYVAAANILSAELAIAPTPEARNAVRNITRSMADMFKQDAGTFNRDTFYNAVVKGTFHTLDYERPTCHCLGFCHCR